MRITELKVRKLIRSILKQNFNNLLSEQKTFPSKTSIFNDTEMKGGWNQTNWESFLTALLAVEELTEDEASLAKKNWPNAAKKVLQGSFKGNVAGAKEFYDAGFDILTGDKGYKVEGEADVDESELDELKLLNTYHDWQDLQENLGGIWARMLNGHRIVYFLGDDDGWAPSDETKSSVGKNYSILSIPLDRIKKEDPGFFKAPKILTSVEAIKKVFPLGAIDTNKYDLYFYDGDLYADGPGTSNYKIGGNYVESGNKLQIKAVSDIMKNKMASYVLLKPAELSKLSPAFTEDIIAQREYPSLVSDNT